MELRKRYLSITDPSQVLVMIVVDEHPAVSASDLTPGPLKKFRAMQMWMPILKHEDGYGFTYGARLAFKDSLGDRSRVSVPMTWGGERRIGLEAERSFDGPISIVRGGVALYRRVNPYFEVPDRRTEARVEADRIVTSWLRAGVDARVAQRASSGPTTRRGTAPRASTRCSTRGSIRRFRATRSTRGSVGSGCSLAGPPAGGTRCARVHRSRRVDWCWRCGRSWSRQTAACRSPSRACSAAATPCAGIAPVTAPATTCWPTSAELRIPLNSPLTFGRFGVKAFVDAGTAWNAGARYDDEPFDRGIGGGVYLGGGPFIIDLDIAKPRTGTCGRISGWA